MKAEPIYDVAVIGGGPAGMMAAARAAQELGAYDRRDEYLRLAHDTTPDAEVAIGIVQAEQLYINSTI